MGFAAKIVITTSIIALLFFAVDLTALWGHIQTIPLYIVVVAAFAWVGATIVNTMRWAALLRVQDLPISFFRLLQYNLAFTFYTVVLPGGKVSAEAVRVYQVARDAELGMRERAALSAIADRMIAALTLVVLSLAATPLLLEMLPELPLWFLYALLASAALVAVSIFMPFELLLFWSAGFLPEVLRSPLSNLGSSFAVFRRNPTQLCTAFILSIAATLLMAAGVHIIAWSLGIAPPFFATLAAFSVGTLTTMIPLTIAGIGIREGAFTYLFATFAGTSLEISLTISLVAFVASLAVAVLGGIVEFRRLFFKRYGTQ